jgi:hypothetical protein
MPFEPSAVLMMLLLILLVQTLAIGAIVLFIYKFFQRGARLLEEASGIIVSTRPRVEESLENIANLISSMEEAGNHMRDIAADLEEVGMTAQDTTKDIVAKYQDTTARAERHIHRVDHLLTNAIDETVAASAYLTRTVYPRIVEVAALVKGVHATIEYLKGKRRFPVSSIY